MPVIKAAGPEEAKLIADLSRQTFIDSFADDNTAADMDLFLAEQFASDMLEAQVGSANNYFFITWEENIPQGYMRLVEHPTGHPDYLPGERSIEINRFYAVKAAIGKGIGPLQMQYALSFAKVRGFDTCWLGVWEKNQRAIRFYSKHGFYTVGSHPFLLGNDLQTDILMAKNL